MSGIYSFNSWDAPSLTLLSPPALSLYIYIYLKIYIYKLYKYRYSSTMDLLLCIKGFWNDIAPQETEQTHWASPALPPSLFFSSPSFLRSLCNPQRTKSHGVRLLILDKVGINYIGTSNKAVRKRLKPSELLYHITHWQHIDHLKWNIC